MVARDRAPGLLPHRRPFGTWLDLLVTRASGSIRCRLIASPCGAPIHGIIEGEQSHLVRKELEGLGRDGVPASPDTARDGSSLQHLPGTQMSIRVQRSFLMSSASTHAISKCRPAVGRHPPGSFQKRETLEREVATPAIQHTTISMH
jgi:hypothetical protein